MLQHTQRKTKETGYVRVEAFNKTVCEFLKYGILGPYTQVVEMA